MIKTWRVLQFAPDRSVHRDWFESYEGSIYGGQNSLNMMDTGLAADSYDLILSNHVLEHVEDDMAAIREMLRLVGRRGLVAMTVPTPIYHWVTEDWRFADETKNMHYREYGADFASNMVNAMSGLKALVAIGRDPVTGIADHVNFLSYNSELLAQMANIWQRNALPVVNLSRG